MGQSKASAAGSKSWVTRRRLQAWERAHAAEAASKQAFSLCFKRKGWRVAFFEGKTGAPRTGIIDAVALRLARRNADVLDLRLVQLKGGSAGINAKEMGRLKAAAKTVLVTPMIVAFDGTSLHLQVLRDEPEGDT